MGMGIREYARHRGITHTSVLKAIANGRIKRNSDGSIDPTKADKAWELNTDQAQQRNHSELAPITEALPAIGVPSEIKATSIPKVAPVIGTSPSPDAFSAKGCPPYQESRAMREYFNAKSTRQEYEFRKKMLVLRKEVDDEIFTENRRVRDRIQNIPSRVAPILAAMTDIQEIEKMLDQELYDALMELS